MSNSKKKSKKRRLSDSDPSPLLPHSKRQKVSHPSYCSRVVSNCSMMEHDVELSTNNNTNHNLILKNSCNHNHNHNHHLHIAEESKELSPEPELLFMNDENDENNEHMLENKQTDKKVLTPMGFNLSDDEIIGMVLEYLEAAGYGQSAECLSKESGIECIPRELDEKYIKQWVLNGEWQNIIDFYESFAMKSGVFESSRCNAYLSATDLFYSKILIIEQKFFELIQQNAKLLATKVLNDELLPLISPSSKREHTQELQTNLANDIESDENEADIELISSLIHHKKYSRKKRRRYIEYNIDDLNSLYPKWRWNKICSLLFCDESSNDLFEELFCGVNNVNDSRYKLYNELECKLVIKKKKKANNNNNNNLLSIFDEFVKCQLFQRQHFNLRSNEISLADYQNNYNEDNIGIPSETYYILDGHRSFITHLSFDASGSWLISSSADKRTLIWDFSDILMQTNFEAHGIEIICDILHYLPVTNHALSPNRKYLMTISEYQANLDDFKHDPNATKHIERQEDEEEEEEEDDSDSNDNNKSNFNVNKRQFKYTHFDESHRTYFDAAAATKRNKNNIKMETERGCNIYLWRLIENESTNKVDIELISQYHHYRREASVCWCPDSEYYLVTSYGCDIDFYCVESGEIVCSLASNGNLMTDLRLTHSGYRLCVTLNGSDIRIYSTDFNEYYKLLKAHLVNKTKDDKEAAPAFIPWLHFCDKNHVNLFENNISKYITKCLISKEEEEEREREEVENNYNDFTHIASISRSSAREERQIIIDDDDDNETEEDDNKSLESLDDKLWIFYEEKLDLDKKTHGQMRNDCIVSTAISCGDEYEYLLVLVHKFNICANRMLHAIILMIDLRSFNHENIKFFYGLKQNRFKLQCGFGGFSLPPIANDALVYRQSKYHHIKNIKEDRNKKRRKEVVEHLNNNKKNKMMREMLEICLKYPSFLPSQMQQQAHMKDNRVILNLLQSLPVESFCKLYKFMQNKLKLKNIESAEADQDLDNNNEMVDVRRQLLEFEVCCILNEEDELQNDEINISRTLKKKRKKKKKKKKRKKKDNENDDVRCMWQRMDSLIDDHHLAMEMKYFLYHKTLKKEFEEEEKQAQVEEIEDENDEFYSNNCSLNKLNLNEMKQISNLINEEKNRASASPQKKKEKKNAKNSLIHCEYIENDYFGGHHFVVSGSEDGHVCIWNRITQKIIKLKGHKKSVNCVAWNPKDSFLLCSAGDDAQIRVWGPKK